VSLPQLLQVLSTFIDNQAESLAAENSELQGLALRAAKYVFDWAVQTEATSRSHIGNLLETLTNVAPPQTRLSTKRLADPNPSEEPQKKKSKIIPLETPIPTLFVEGMSMEQIWKQLDLRGGQVCEHLQVLEGEEEGEGEDGFNEDDSSDMDEEEELEESEGDDEEEGSLQEEEQVAVLQEGTSEEEDEDDEGDLSMFDTVRKKPAASKAPKHSEVDDDFFDLQEFNAETEQAEAKSVSKGRLRHDSDSEDSGDDEPDIDLFEPVDGAEDEEEMSGVEYFYRDFFDRPRSSTSHSRAGTSKQSKVRFHDQVKVKKIKAKGKGLPVSTMMYEEEEDDDDDDYIPEDSDEEVFGEGIEEDDDDDDEEDDENEDENEDEDEDEGNRSTIERLKDDLFAEEEEQQKNQDMTTHERRIAALQEQITQLESENVAKKDWVLMGEVSSKGRPQDSLLQEDLEFERIAKAVPIVTEEVVASLEARIKARILEGRFDDVVRRRPMDDKPFLPSRFFELQDSKSQQSLAQIYENEYIAAQTGTSTDDRDGKLKKEHDEITKLWEGLCNKLDALCNAHYVPKQPKATITTISDVPAATLESALPVGKSLSSMLAPEEVFAPVSSDPRTRSELTPAEKRAMRTKERKARKKAQDKLEKSVNKHAKVKGVKQQKDAALKSLVKSGKGVTVVGKEIKKAKTTNKRKS
ncbi:U3 small nucleolar ribonucleoprotein complex, subunit Mpp10, partial [Scleroderma citrinum]